jgi:hypothetical protein
MKLITHLNRALTFSANGTSFKSLASRVAEKGAETQPNTKLDQSTPSVEMLGERPMPTGAVAEMAAVVWSEFRARLAAVGRWLCRTAFPRHRDNLSKEGVEHSPALDWETCGISYARPALALTDVGKAAGELLAHFKNLIRGRPRTYRYGHTFACGGEAVVQFKQFRKAALMTVRWRRPCGCLNEEQQRRCKRELGGWLEKAEAHEVAADHFRFRHEGSLTFDLGQAGTIIWQPQGDKSV